MTNERIINSVEMMSFDELDRVAGSTVAEFNDIWAALEKRAGTGDSVSNGLRGILNGMPYESIGVVPWRNVSVQCAEKALKDGFGIVADISVGWGGTGFHERANTYSKNGQSLSHQQVLGIINA